MELLRFARLGAFRPAERHMSAGAPAVESTSGPPFLDLASVGVSIAALGLSRLGFNLIGNGAFGIELVGSANICLSIALLIGLPTSAGLAAAVSRFVPLCADRADALRLVCATMRLALLTVAAGLAIALLILAVSRPARLTPDLLPVTVLWTVLYAVYALSRSHLYAERRVRQALVLELAGFASFAAALAVSRARPVLWWLPFAVYPLPVAGRALALWMRGPLSGRLGDWPGLTRFATLAFLGSASSLGIQYGSTLVIGATGGAASAGVWATLTSIAAPVLLLPRSLSTLYLPRLAKLTLASREAFETMSAKHLRMATMCALPIVALFALLGPYALPSVLGGSQDRTVLATWTILCTSTYVVCRKEPLITAVAALGRAGVNATAAFVGATACAIVWILAPMFIPQLLAVAAGALVQAFGTPTVAAWLAQRRDAAHRVRWSIRLSDAAMLTVAALSLLAPLDPRAVLSGILVVLVATSIEIWHARTADRALGPS